MATYTSGFGIKLITTGAESGTWGSSTNANLSAIDEAIASYYSINVNVPPTNSTWTAGSNLLAFLLDDFTTARTNGSQGRGSYIKFAQTTGSGGTAPPTGSITVQLRGNTASDYPYRFFVAENALTDATHDITFDVGSANDFILKNGQVALLYTYIDASASNNFVKNAFDNMYSASVNVGTSLLPDEDGGADIGSTNKAWGDVFIADDKYIKFGDDQDITFGYAPGSSTLDVVAKNDQSVSLRLQADNSDDAGDDWLLQAGASQVFSIGNDIASAGSYVSHIDITPNATIGNSIVSCKGNLEVATALLPDGNGLADIGSASLGWGDTYIADDKKIKFGNDQDVTMEYDEDGTDALLISGGDVVIADDKKLYFGTGKDASIEYDEDGVDALAISSTQFSVAGGVVTIKGAQDTDAELHMYADNGDDNADKWRILVEAGATQALEIQSYTSGSWDTWIAHNSSTDNVGVYAAEFSVSGDMVFGNGIGDSVTTTGRVISGYAGSLDGKILYDLSTTDASDGTAWSFLKCVEDSASSGGDVMFRLDGDGTGRAATSWVTTGLDYAEFFEWLDGNPDNEDRVGHSVVLEDGKVRLSESTDDPSDVIGIVSSTPGVVGNSVMEWPGRYKVDVFGRPIELSGKTVHSDDYRKDEKYVPREERREWAVIGLMGQIRLRRGLLTHPNWRKIRDESNFVETWLVR